MTSKNKNNHDILASSLFQLCTLQSSGTVFILTDDDRHAQIVLKNSVITGFNFADQHGLKAIDNFKNANLIDTKFIENYEYPMTKDAAINCSEQVLTDLGFNEYLMITNTQNSYTLMQSNSVAA